MSHLIYNFVVLIFNEVLKRRKRANYWNFVDTPNPIGLLHYNTTFSKVRSHALLLQSFVDNVTLATIIHSINIRISRDGNRVKLYGFRIVLISFHYYKLSLVSLIIPRKLKICGKFWSCHGFSRFQDNITIILKIFATGKYIPWQRSICA